MTTIITQLTPEDVIARAASSPTYDENIISVRLDYDARREAVRRLMQHARQGR